MSTFTSDEFMEVTVPDVPDHYTWPRCPYCGMAYESARDLDNCVEFCAKMAITHPVLFLEV